eukprot:2594673-Prymnesium_polylepis.1
MSRGRCVHAKRVRHDASAAQEEGAHQSREKFIWLSAIASFDHTLQTFAGASARVCGLQYMCKRIVRPGG